MNIKEFTIALAHYQCLLPGNAPDFDNKFVLKFWFERLSPYGSKKLSLAFNSLALKVDRFPSLRMIIEELEGREKPNNAAVTIASKITAAISKFGYCNAKEAKEYLGDIGWSIVEMSGGWNHLCGTVTNKHLSTFQAQWRELAKAHVDKIQNGQLTSLNGNLSNEKRLSNGKATPLEKALQIIENGP